MRLAKIELFRYRLKLARAITSDASLTHREGLVVRVEDESDHVGFGEVAPLPGFSAETLHECREQMVRWRWSVLRQEVPQHLEELSGGFAQWLGQHDMAGSVRCGIEMAVLSLQTSSQGVPLRELLADMPQETLRLNALLSGDSDEVLSRAAQAVTQGYTAVKLKIGHNAIDQDVRLIGMVREACGPDMRLRLDANRTFNVDSALELIGAVAPYVIEYVEEPVGGMDGLRELLQRSPSVPIAIDESLVDLEPAMLRELPAVAAVILKPTLLGLERSMAFARAATAIGATPVVTSMFESGVGLSVLAQFAASITPAEVAVGLDTRAWLAEDLLKGELYAAPGLIRLSQLDDFEARLVTDRLQEVKCD